MREKPNVHFWWQQLREEISPAQVIPYRDLRPPPPTPLRTLLLMQPVRTLGKGCLNPWPPQKHAQPVVNGDTGRWTVPRDTLAPLGRSPSPRPGEWNIHRDALVPLGRSPLLPRTPAQPYESCSNGGAQVPAPQPMSQTRARNLG